MNKNVIIILGATATGKSDFAISCAEKLNGEIISADSMQIYKELNIGTAKIDKIKMNKIPHHLINIKHFYEDYNVWQFVQDCKCIIKQIFSKNKRPIIVGGTNLYINALIRDYEFNNIKKDKKLRDELNKFINENGLKALYERFVKIYPEIAQNSNPNDKSRLIREIECAIAKSFKDNIIVDSTMRKTKSEKKSEFNFSLYALDLPREILYKRINARVDKMVEDGLFNEVENLKNKGLNIQMQSGKGIGYREVLSYFDDEKSYDFTIDKIKQHTRNFAKRQYTWMRSLENILWLNILDYKNALNIVLKKEF